MDLEVAELVKIVEDSVNRSDVSISIRSEEGVFLYVNNVWENAFNRSLEDVVGKKLVDLEISSPQEISASDAVDDLLRAEKSIVEIATYGPYTKIVVIRAFIVYKKVGYRIILAFNSTTYQVSSPSDWSSERADRAWGELLAARLRLIEISRLLDT